MTSNIRDLIESVNYTESCRGLGGKEIATSIVKSFFEDEGLSFENWQVTEIPLAYEEGVSVCITNRATKQGIAIWMDENAKFVCAFPDELEEIDFPTIKEAISHPDSYYEPICEEVGREEIWILDDLKDFSFDDFDYDYSGEQCEAMNVEDESPSFQSLCDMEHGSVPLTTEELLCKLRELSDAGFNDFTIDELISFIKGEWGKG